MQTTLVDVPNGAIICSSCGRIHVCMEGHDLGGDPFVLGHPLFLRGNPFAPGATTLLSVQGRTWLRYVAVSLDVAWLCVACSSSMAVCGLA